MHESSQGSIVMLIGFSELFRKIRLFIFVQSNGAQKASSASCVCGDSFSFFSYRDQVAVRAPKHTRFMANSM